MSTQAELIEGNVSAVYPQPAGIGGWLILPAIGLVLGAIVGVGGLILGFALFSDVEAAGFGRLAVIVGNVTVEARARVAHRFVAA